MPRIRVDGECRQTGTEPYAEPGGIRPTNGQDEINSLCPMRDIRAKVKFPKLAMGSLASNPNKTPTDQPFD